MTKFKRPLVPGAYLTAADMLALLAEQRLAAAALPDGTVALAAHPAVAWLLDSCCVGRGAQSRDDGGGGGGGEDDEGGEGGEGGSAAAPPQQPPQLELVTAAAGVNAACPELQAQFEEHLRQELQRQQRRGRRGKPAPQPGGSAAGAQGAGAGADGAGGGAVLLGEPPPTDGAAAAAGPGAQAPGLVPREQPQQAPGSSGAEVQLVRLSLPEAFFLAHVLGSCSVTPAPAAPGGGGALGAGALWGWCCAAAPGGAAAFATRFAAYRHFRAKGWLPLPGLPYGGDYVLYALHPALAHSEFVVTVMLETAPAALPAAPAAAGGAGTPDGAPAPSLAWLDAHIMQRLARQVLKQLLLLYVVAPPGLSFDRPDCVDRLAVREVLVSRWVPSEHREEARRPGGKQQSAPPGGRRRIVVPLDDSQPSLRALEWAVTELFRQGDELHLLSVTPRVPGPYPAEVLDADVPAASSDTVKAWRSEAHAHESETEALLSFMRHHAVNLGVRPPPRAARGSLRRARGWLRRPSPSSRGRARARAAGAGGQVEDAAVKVAALAATGGASGVGASIADYVSGADAHTVVLGSRGLHGWQRHFANLLGLGSVSYYTVLHSQVPVVVVKGGEP
ncbi:TSEN2 [Scenedesmus sp. PABB004]|nr:TSEN2 [Scenedesmus sp. PABB004]